MTAKDPRECTAFFSSMERRIARELELADTDGLRSTARKAALDRAHALAGDLDYLRDCYAGARA